MGAIKPRTGVVIGVDIARAGGPDLSRYLYSIAIVREGTVASVDEGSLGRIIRLLWDNRPSTLAVDNILELGGSKRGLAKILKLLPPDTEIVQVTLNEKQPITLKEAALKAGLGLGREKLDSRRTAALIAILASLGYGEVLNVFEGKVKINVYMGRNGSAGGSRSSKYKRNLRGAVARVVKRIREDLDEAGIDYDVTIRRSRGGIERASFVVYAPREKLYGIVRRAKGKDVIVKIRPVIRKEFLALRGDGKQKKYLIVGFDPGTKVGIALIDLDGNPVLITSGKNLDRGSLASLISREGIPAVVATDKTPVPDMVRKLASTLNAQLYVPPRSLSTAEKELIVEEFTAKHNIQIRNAHERDALSAAVKAFRLYEEKLGKLTSKVREMGLPHVGLQEYKARLLSNEPLSSIIEEMINDSVSEKPDLVKEKIKPSEQPRNDSVVKELMKKVEELTRERDIYRTKVKELEKTLEKMESKLEGIQQDLLQKILKNRKIMELTQRVNNLESYVNKLRAENDKLAKLNTEIIKVVDRVLAGELVFIPSLTGKCRLRMLGEGMVWFVDDFPSAPQELLRKVVNCKCSLVLHPKDQEHLDEVITKYLVPAAVAKEVWIIDNCVRAVNSSIHEALREAKRRIEEIKETSRNKLTYSTLESIINEYRTSRKGVMSIESHDHESYVGNND